MKELMEKVGGAADYIGSLAMAVVAAVAILALIGALYGPASAFITGLVALGTSAFATSGMVVLTAAGVLALCKYLKG